MKLATVQVGSPIHYADFEGEGPTLVLVHGLGGSHCNWLPVGPALAARTRVIAPDLPGFGLSPPGRRATVDEIVGALGRFLDVLAPRPVVLFGNSLGGTVSILAALARPDRIAGLVLVAPALPLRIVDVTARSVAYFGPYLVPGLAERMHRSWRTRRGPERVVRDLLELVTWDSDRVDPATVAAHVELARRRQDLPWVDSAFVAVTRSLLGLLATQRLQRALREIDAPVLLVHGTRDRLVPVASIGRAHRQRPDWTLETLVDVGHAPQLEVPDRFLAVVEPWLDRYHLLDSAEGGSVQRRAPWERSSAALRSR